MYEYLLIINWNNVELLTSSITSCEIMQLCGFSILYLQAIKIHLNGSRKNGSHMSRWKKCQLIRSVDESFRSDIGVIRWRSLYSCCQIHTSCRNDLFQSPSDTWKKITDVEMVDWLNRTFGEKVWSWQVNSQQMNWTN